MHLRTATKASEVFSSGLDSTWQWRDVRSQGDVELVVLMIWVTNVAR
jgi:hypothetical protein